MSLIAAALSVALQSGPEQETRVAVADLIGQTPTQVAAALGAPRDPLAADAFRIVEDGRAVDVYPARRFWRLASATSGKPVTQLWPAEASRQNRRAG